jgi:hypothetical protein
MNSLLLSGAWRLVSFEIINPQGERKPWGREMHGSLIYAADESDESSGDSAGALEQGWMSASINRAVEPDHSDSAEEILDSCLFYSGRYERHPDEVRHFVTEATDPQRIGKTLIRYPEWDGVTLRLTSPQQPWGIAVIAWQKLSLSATNR